MTDQTRPTGATRPGVARPEGVARPAGATRRRKRRRSLAPTLARVGAVSCAATLALGGFLAVQMANGQDPVLGPKAVASIAPVHVKRRIVEKTVIVRRVQDDDEQTASQGAASASVAAASQAPATSVSAPAAAPAPAPVVTSVS